MGQCYFKKTSHLSRDLTELLSLKSKQSRAASESLVTIRPYSAGDRHYGLVLFLAGRVPNGNIIDFLVDAYIFYDL